MPQHGHGLPTRPRVTRSLGEGIYEIEGVRFNMGGWWGIKLRSPDPAVRTRSRSTSISDSGPAMTNRMFTTIALALFATIPSAAASGRAGWTSAQFDELRSMSLASLEYLPPDRSQPRRRRSSRRRPREAAVLRHSAERQRFGSVSDSTAAAAWASMTDSQRDAVTRVFVNVGKAIAAYERRIDFGPSRFDRYVDAISDTGRGDGILTSDEIAGLKLFIGKANCTQCHNGPLFTNNEFHNTGVPRRPELPSDVGRLTGASRC